MAISHSGRTTGDNITGPGTHPYLDPGPALAPDPPAAGTSTARAIPAGPITLYEDGRSANPEYGAMGKNSPA